jgi:hypothetical protein
MSNIVIGTSMLGLHKLKIKDAVNGVKTLNYQPVYKNYLKMFEILGSVHLIQFLWQGTP